MNFEFRLRELQKMFRIGVFPSLVLRNRIFKVAKLYREFESYHLAANALGASLPRAYARRVLSVHPMDRPPGVTRTPLVDWYRVWTQTTILVLFAMGEAGIRALREAAIFKRGLIQQLAIESLIGHYKALGTLATLLDDLADHHEEMGSDGIIHAAATARDFDYAGGAFDSLVLGLLSTAEQNNNTFEQLILLDAVVVSHPALIRQRYNMLLNLVSRGLDALRAGGSWPIPPSQGSLTIETRELLDGYNAAKILRSINVEDISIEEIINVVEYSEDGNVK